MYLEEARREGEPSEGDRAGPGKRWLPEPRAADDKSDRHHVVDLYHMPIDMAREFLRGTFGANPDGTFDQTIGPA